MMMTHQHTSPHHVRDLRCGSPIALRPTQQTPHVCPQTVGPRPEKPAPQRNNNSPCVHYFFTPASAFFKCGFTPSPPTDTHMCTHTPHIALHFGTPVPALHDDTPPQRAHRTPLPPLALQPHTPPANSAKPNSPTRSTTHRDVRPVAKSYHINTHPHPPTARSRYFSPMFFVNSTPHISFFLHLLSYIDMNNPPVSDTTTINMQNHKHNNTNTTTQTQHNR